MDKILAYYIPAACKISTWIDISVCSVIISSKKIFCFGWYDQNSFKLFDKNIYSLDQY
jgi:hypothetical protein